MVDIVAQTAESCRYPKKNTNHQLPFAADRVSPTEVQPHGWRRFSLLLAPHVCKDKSLTPKIVRDYKAAGGQRWNQSIVLYFSVDTTV